MKASKLAFDDLIRINPNNEIMFHTKRMSLVPVEALGLLRRDLIHTLGMERAKGFLMRYGWACGMRDGETIASMYEWDNLKELMLAGPVLHTLRGVVTAVPDHIEIDDDYIYLSGVWENSFEAIEHLNHHDYSENNGCWTLLGYASGYLTKTFGKDVLAYETQCVGRGDDTCRFVAKSLDVYSRKDNEIMKYYKAASIVEELDQMQQELHHMNQNIIDSDQFHQELTNMLVEDKELIDTIRFVANRLNKSIVIDYYNKIIECAFMKDSDEASYRNWSDKFIYKEEQQNDIRTFPIRASNVNLGRLVVISQEKMTQRDELMIKRALAIFTVQMHHQYKITQSLWKKKENFFEEMLLHHDKEHFEKFAYFFNFHPNGKNRIASIKVLPEASCKDVMKFFKHHPMLKQVDYFYNKNNVILILPEENVEKTRTFMQEVLSELKKEFQAVKFFIGVGRVSEDLHVLSKSYEDASSISDFVLLSQPLGNCIAYYEEMGPAMMLLKGAAQHELIDFYKTTLGEIIKHDQTNGTDYLMTLKTYLDYNGNLQQTANELHLSIAGLRYRMERIEQFCQIDLKTGEGRFKSQLAIQIYLATKINADNQLFPSLTTKR